VLTQQFLLNVSGMLLADISHSMLLVCASAVKFQRQSSKTCQLCIIFAASLCMQESINFPCSSQW
jgi:hypothetical protein